MPLLGASGDRYTIRCTATATYNAPCKHLP